MSITDQHLAAYIDKIFANYDRDNSGTLDNTEMTAFFNDVYMAIGRKEAISGLVVQQALGIMDKDFNGRLSREELFIAFKEILNKEGFYVNNQNVYTNTGHNYNQAIDMWRTSQKMGHILPYFGSTLNQNIHQGGLQPQNVYNSHQMQASQFQNNQFQNNQFQNPYQSQFNQTPNTFGQQQMGVTPNQYPQSVPQGYMTPEQQQQLQQQQLNQMIALHNEHIKQYEQNVLQHQQSQLQAQRRMVETQKAQIEAQKAQIQAQLNQIQQQQAQMAIAQQQQMIAHQQQQQQQQQMYGPIYGQFGYNQPQQPQLQNYGNMGAYGYGGNY